MGVRSADLPAMMIAMDLLARPVLTADHRIPYGKADSQFGDLWLPRTAKAAPLVVLYHGGWWKAAYDLGYAGYFCRALRDHGIAVWSVEYRRVGNGGGWPNTFLDAAAGMDFVAELATRFPLNLNRVITAGHSAGGHLAFWAAGRQHVPPGSPVDTPPHVQRRGALSLAGAVALQDLIALSTGEFAHDRDEVVALMGGTPDEVPERYAAGDPAALLPLAGTQVLLQGTLDDQIPPALPERFAAKARQVGSTASVRILPGADHFDVIDPDSKAWPAVLAAVQKLLS